MRHTQPFVKGAPQLADLVGVGNFSRMFLGAGKLAYHTTIRQNINTTFHNPHSMALRHTQAFIRIGFPLSRVAPRIGIQPQHIIEHGDLMVDRLATRILQ